MFPFPLISPNPGYSFVRSLTTTTDYNLRTAALAAGWDGIVPLLADITIGAGETISASTISGYAFDTDVSFPVGSIIAIAVAGTVRGKGGNGGVSVFTGAQAGGPAMALRSTCPWSLSCSGSIIGGGGGGGYGGGKHSPSSDAWHAAQPGAAGGAAIVATSAGTITGAGTFGGGGAGGSGGTGDPTGLGSGGGGGGGAGFGGAGAANTYACPATDGTAGTLLAPGAGGAGSDCGYAGTAGDTGGALGSGACLSGLAYVNSGAGITTGTRYGAQA